MYVKTLVDFKIQLLALFLMSSQCPELILNYVFEFSYSNKLMKSGQSKLVSELL